MKKIFIIFTLVLLVFTVSCDDYMEDLLFQSKLTEGLVAYWPVTETYTSSTSYGKTIKDYSGNNNDLISYQNGGGPTALAFVPGVFSTALSFDGSNDFAELNRTNLNLLKGSNEFSISLWFYSKGNSNKYVLSCLAFNVYTDGPFFSFYLNSENVENNTVQLNQWFYITVTYDRSNIKLYINGLLKDQSSYSTNLNLFDLFQLGQDGSNMNFYYGLLDEIRVYNRALSQEEIEAIMDMGVN